jgi:hypothetical protein
MQYISRSILSKTGSAQHAVDDIKPTVTIGYPRMQDLSHFIM